MESLVNKTIEIDQSLDINFMQMALREAQKAERKDEVPIGAIIVQQNKIIARGHNQTEMLRDATAHAEMLALTSAQSHVGDWRLIDCDVYVTKEPCIMCAGAIVHCRIRRVIFGCPDQKCGAAGSWQNILQEKNLNHTSQITEGVCLEQCRHILKTFFAKARQKKKN